MGAIESLLIRGLLVARGAVSKEKGGFQVSVVNWRCTAQKESWVGGGLFSSRQPAWEGASFCIIWSVSGQLEGDAVTDKRETVFLSWMRGSSFGMPSPSSPLGRMPRRKGYLFSLPRACGAVPPVRWRGLPPPERGPRFDC